MENQAQKKDSGKKRAEATGIEKFWRVMLSDKTSPNDTDDVELSVNGETLMIQRGIEVIIPDRFKVCADNSTYQQFTQIPGKPRKLRGIIKVYPYQLMGEAKQEDFIKMKRKGDRRTKEVIAQFGFDGVPDGS